MARLEDLKRGAIVGDILPNALVTVVDAKWHGSFVVELTYKDPEGRLGNELLYRDREPTLEIATAGRPWGDVWQTLFHKLEEERKALGGSVFDILGKLFRDQPLRQLMVEAIRYGDRPDVRARLLQKANNLADRERCRELLEEKALAHNSMDASRVRQIREDMERAEARRLQPHYVEGFFLEAFRHLGGAAHKREPRRYEVSHVPALVRSRDRAIGRGAPLLPKYERVTFEKGEITLPGKPLAAFICPGHPLLDATIDLTLERHRDLLKRGAILVDPGDPSEEVRALLYLEHGIQVARLDRAGNRREVSRRLQFVEARLRPPPPPSADASSPSPRARLDGFVAAGYAPYLDYRAPTDEERALLRPFLGTHVGVPDGLEEQAVGYAVEHLVPEHVAEVSSSREAWLARTMAAVKERLTKEIIHWDHRVQELKAQESAGRTPRLNSTKAQQRANDLEDRLQKRMKDLEDERRLSPLPPVVIGGALVVPLGLLLRLRGGPVAAASAEADARTSAEARTRIERAAIEAVLAAERRLGFEPRDRSADKCGYDVESRVPGTGKLRFLEVKGRVADARTVTVTRNEILTALNKPEDFILAIVLVDGQGTPGAVARYIYRPFQREPDFGAESVNYDLDDMLGRAEEPR